MNWDVWWVWVAAGIALAILELFAPGYIFLGFAVGAVVVGIMLAIGGQISAVLVGSLSAKLLVLALASLVAWLVMRRVAGERKGQKKVWDTDINED